MISITLPDGSKLSAENGSTLFDIIGQIGKSLQKAALAASVDGEAKDLNFIPQKDFSLKVITFKDAEGKKLYWHSTSHLMAQAVKNIFPKVKLAIGPSIDEGFYYDFDAEKPFTPEDLASIEKEMTRLSQENINIVRSEIPVADLKKKFADMGETYKVELLDAITDEMGSVYTQGNFFDLCRGPHVAKTGDIKAFKLLRVAGAYWRGDEKNKMLQRIYGISFPDKKELDDYIRLQEEAKERDHRRIGKDQHLFEVSNEVGQGLILWAPKGARIRVLIEDFWRKEHYKNGYEIIYTPHIGRSLLWETSGHLSFYKDGMYSPMDIDGEDYYVKPMNCPFHVMVYKSEQRSYRDFPVKFAEFGTVYRYERSGTLHGLLRVRGFTQDDAHIFCRLDQITDEILAAFNFSMFMLKKFGFENFKIKISTRPEKEYVGSVELWDKAEAALKEALQRSGMSYEINEGDGAFYGPKIDIAVKDAIGRDWQLSTVQLDFNLPERFDISYSGSDGKDHRPIMIHRALLGSLERFFGILVEHYKGAFPVWLAPVQCVIINVSENEAEGVKALQARMKQEELRVDIDLSNETMGYKIRNAVTSRVPYVAVLGKKEIEAGSVSVRRRGSDKPEVMSCDDFIALIKSENN
ncbi:MAG TPA: threonine--tRNA ligase [Spirochaetota bacterium]|nr:threonine--tRNA ligase [Spirochaetota bacterium]HOR44260.1 threonine--tRNA ligase [Spirochaetota bacterium]HOU84637.1 threonine--tRNA ligase [Spirochaetota bacterium]HPK55628.1 threonine--tRNA ligase [Spirochaetota bacterium]HQE58881.1 threonine--tRNA ligase [Spirochaetota bacterium]